MAEEHELAFAREAQEEAAASQVQSAPSRKSSQSSKNSVRVENTDLGESAGETSPLLGSTDTLRRRQKYQRASQSYIKAINEPWTGAHGQDDFPWYKKPSIFWLLPAFAPFCIAFGGIIVPKTYLILDMICRDYLSDKAAHDPNFTYLPVLFGADNEQCDIPEVQALVSYFNTYSDLLAGIFSAIVAPIYGSLSDRYGRKKLIVLTSMGGLINEALTIVIGRNADKISVYWLLFGFLADGLCGSFTTALALSFSFASDCSSPQKRSVAFGYFHGTLFAGIALGPIVASFLIEATGNNLSPFYFALGCHLFFITFTAFIVPESLSKERQVLAREKHAAAKAKDPDQSFFQTIKKFNIFEPLWILRPTGEGSSPAVRRNIVVIAAIDTLMFGIAMGTMRIILIYAKYRWHWNTVETGIFMSACNVVRVSGLLGLLPLLTRIFRGPTASNVHHGSDKLDLYIIRASVTFDLAGYIGYALSPRPQVMFVAGLVAALGGIGSPTLQSSLTKHVPADMTGQVLGASGLLHALARVVAPVVFNLIYAKTVKWYSGFVFLCLASIFVVTFILSWFLKPNVYLRDTNAVEQEEDQPNNAEEQDS